MSISLPNELEQRCVDLLKQCEEFKSHALLCAFFGISELVHLRDSLPEVHSLHERATLTLHYLVERKIREEWALVVFIVALRKRYDAQDDRTNKLERLESQILTTLETSAKSQQAVSIEERGYRETVEAAAEVFTREEQGSKTTSAVEAWFEQAGNDESLWALRLALTVFNNGPRTAFVEARQHLIALLQSVEQPASIDSSTEKPPIRTVTSLFDGRNKLSKLLDQAEADLDEVQVDPQDLRAGTVEIVCLRDSDLAYAALPYVWQEYDRARPALIQWLTELAINRSSADTRSRAAVAVGVLAVSDFINVRDQILRRWGDAKNDRALFRTAIGRALGVAVQAPRRREEVLNLLAFWSKHTSQATRWVAARAYIYVGATIEAEEVLRQWRRIYAAEPEAMLVLEHWRILCDTRLSMAALISPPEQMINQPTPQWLASQYFYLQQNQLRRNPLLSSLVDGIFTFFVYGATLPIADARSLFIGIMRGILEWDEADREQCKVRDDRRLASFPLLMFLLLLRLLHRPEGGSETGSPLVLALIEQEPGAPFRQTLAELLLLCYHRRQPTRQPLLDELHTLLDYVDGRATEIQIHTLFSDLVAIAPHGSRICESVLYELNRWARQSGHTDSPYHRAAAIVTLHCNPS